MTFSPDVQQAIEMCRYCFMCRHANPTFLVTKLDSHTPRGYALLISRIEAGLDDWTVDVAEKLYQSTLDGLCRELCGFHWAENDVVRAGREEAIRHGVVPPPVRNAIGDLLADPDLPLPPEALDQLGARCDRTGAQVLYLTGRLARSEAPDLILAMAAILDGSGADWTVLQREPDSGAELWDLGLSAEARDAGRRLVATVAELGPRLIVTGDAHACHALRELYPSWGLDGLRGVEILHVAEYLAQGIASGARPLAAAADVGKVAYHDSCRLGRGLRVIAAPRAVITAVTGRPPVEFPHSGLVAECCGGGSLLYVTYPALSRAMGEARLRSILDAGVDTIVSACPTCRRVLRDAARAAGLGIRVMDLTELVVVAAKDGAATSNIGGTV